jgi:hypothetical protein
MKRQRGRNRGGGGGGGKPQQNANRAFDSNGPDGVKVRGNAQHVFEKYQQLARDANGAGDRVLAENYLQHAEHYFRLLRAIQPNRPASEILGRDQFASGYDIDFEDESGQAQGEVGEEVGGEGVDARSDGGDGRDQNRDRERDRDRDRPRDRDRGEWQGRDRDGEGRRDRDGRDRDRWRDRDRDRSQGSQNRDQNRDRSRDERPRVEGEERRDRYERPDRDRERAERADRDPLAVVQPQGDPQPEPRNGPMLRDAEGGESHAPAFLQARPGAAPGEAGEEKAPRPRRRRAPRSFEAGEGGPTAGEPEEV